MAKKILRVVLIDDERPALRGLAIFLKEYPLLEVAGMFTNPLEALAGIGQLQPEVIFLDINMPQLQGIDAASRILDEKPDTEIVFVTAYDQYAIEAFELQALDYLLKPLNQERLAKTIARLLAKNRPERQAPDKQLEIKCLGRLEVAWTGEAPLKLRSEKTKELFAYLLLQEGRDITKEELLDKLWAEHDPEVAVRQLYNGIYYIRKALAEYGVEESRISIDSRYHLRLGRVRLDIKDFHQLEGSQAPGSIAALENLAALYTGDYLENKDYPWADLERERLAKLYQQCLLHLAQKLLEEEEWDKAENYLMKAYLQNPYPEDITERLLQVYQKTGNVKQARRHYHRYAELIREELGINPSRPLRDLMKTLE